jgi:phytoene desaturase
MKVVIIGAGIGGLATANLLAQDGHEVHIYEQADTLGGRAGQFKQDGFTFDTGPSWYLMPEVFERYFQLVGTSTKKQLNLKKLSPAYKVFYEDGESITITGNLKKDAPNFEAIEAGAGAALERYVAKSDELYTIALEHFLYSNFTKPNDLINAAIARKAGRMLDVAFTPLHKYVSRFVKHQKLQQILEYPAVFLGTSPYKAPALYSLMSALDFKEGVYYPIGTMHQIVESLVRIGTEKGVHYHSDAPVKRIKTREGVAEGITLQDGTPIEADLVISNADLHHTETKLLSTSDRSYPARYWNKKEASPSALLMFLGVKGRVPEFEHHTLLFVDDWQKNFADIYTRKTAPDPASLYISKTSASDTTAPEGHENLFVLVPLPAGKKLSPDTLEKLADRYLRQIQAMTGVDIASRIVTRKLFGPNDFQHEYNAWQGSMLGPSHLLTQSAFFRTPNKSKRVRNLYYVGAGTVPGVGVPMCLISAELVHKRITEGLR